MPERPTPPSWVVSLQIGLQEEIGINEEQAKAAANAFWILSDTMGFPPDVIRVRKVGGQGMVGLEIPPDVDSPEAPEAKKIHIIFYPDMRVQAFTPNSFNEVHWTGEKITYSYAQGVTIPGREVPLSISASRKVGKIVVGVQEDMLA